MLAAPVQHFFLKTDVDYGGLLRWLQDKESPSNAGDTGSIPGSGRSPGEGNGNTFQCSCLENPMVRGAWGVISPWGSQRVGHD